MDEKLLEKAKEAKTLDELKGLLSNNGFDMEDENAEEFYARIHSDEELSDEELDGLSGGREGKGYYSTKCPRCDMYTMVISGRTLIGRCSNCRFEFYYGHRKK